MTAAMGWCTAGLLVCAALFLFHRSLGRLFRLVLRSAAGLGVLALFSRLSPLLGVSLGVNCFNALVLGLLGAPGFALLLLVQWLLR